MGHGGCTLAAVSARPDATFWSGRRVVLEGAGEERTPNDEPFGTDATQLVAPNQ